MLFVKRGLIGFFLLAWSITQAQVDFQTSIRDMELGSPEELAGEMTMVVRGDWFATASAETPTYIRLRFGSGERLSHTLEGLPTVSPGGGLSNDPIRLAALLDNPGTQSLLAMNPDAITIVRWRADENQIWIKVSQSSSEWVNRDGVLGAPDSEDRVAVRLSVTATRSQAFTSDAFNNGLASLAANSRQDDVAADTQIYLDLRNTTIKPASAPPSQSLIGFDPTALDSTTQDVVSAVTPAEIQVGQLLPVPFSGDTAIGRGIAGSGPGPLNRWLVHVPRASRGFTTFVRLMNPAPFSGEVVLNAFDSAGEPTGNITIQVVGTSFPEFSLEELFGQAEISHIGISGDAFIKCLLGTKARWYRSGSTFFEESSQTQARFTLPLDTKSIGFIGFAAINRGTSAATINVKFYDENGQVLADNLLSQADLQPGAKGTWALTQPRPPQGAVALEVLSNQALTGWLLGTAGFSGQIIPLMPLSN